ncbi:MAG: hypothetical protein AAF790_02030 [Planctomycetota bacterium]
MKRLRRLAIGLSMLCFAGSLVSHVAVLQDADGTQVMSDMRGWYLLAFGWLAPLGGWLAVEWWANPLLVCSWVSLWRGDAKCALWWACFALALGMIFSLRSEFMTSTKPDWAQISGYQVGYWFWLASMAFAGCGSLACVRTESVLKEVTD